MEGIGYGWNGWFGMVLGLDMKWFLRWFVDEIAFGCEIESL
jgi:hypothetical protein